MQYYCTVYAFGLIHVFSAQLFSYRCFVIDIFVLCTVTSLCFENFENLANYLLFRSCGCSSPFQFQYLDIAMCRGQIYLILPFPPKVVYCKICWFEAIMLICNTRYICFITFIIFVVCLGSHDLSKQCLCIPVYL